MTKQAHETINLRLMNNLPQGLLLILLLSCFGLSVSAEDGFQPTAIQIEARSIIAQQVADEAARKADRRAELMAIPSIERREMQQDNRWLTINQVAPPSSKKTAPTRTRLSDQQPKLSDAEFTAHIAMQGERPENQSISLSVTVYGGAYSKVLWRQPRSGESSSQMPQEFEIWTNFNLSYLSAISSFEWDNVTYDYFGFTEAITEESETRKEAFVREGRYDEASRWQSSPVDFNPGRLEYIVTHPANSPVPSELYQQMDALLSYYLEHQASLKTAYQRNEALAQARQQWQRENPSPPENVVINFYPLSSRHPNNR